MATTKPQSTISYNTECFLQGTLKSLVKANIAKFACYVKHQGEDDESHKKDHFHVYIEPSRRVEQNDLRQRFIEVVPNEQPLGCITFRDSKWRDWYLYGKHDVAYLESKNMSRKYHYTEDDFWSTDKLYFEQISFEIEEQKTPYDDIQIAIETGVSVEEYILQRKVPIPQIENVRRAYLIVKSVVNSRSYMNSSTVFGTAKATENVYDCFVIFTNGKTDFLTFGGKPDIAKFLHVDIADVLCEYIAFQGENLVVYYNRHQNRLVQNIAACNIFSLKLYGDVVVADFSKGVPRSLSPRIGDVLKQFA